MDEKKIYEDILKKYEELREEYDSVYGDIVAFEETDDIKTYDAIDDDVVKKTMFPEQYEAYEKMSELEEKLDHFNIELNNKAKALYLKYKSEVENLENKIKTNEEYVEKLEEEIERLNNEYEELVNSDEYKRGDEESLIRAEDLKGQIKQKKSLSKKLKENLEKYTPIVEEYKKEMEELDNMYMFGEEMVEDSPEKDEDSPKKDEGESEKLSEKKKKQKSGRVSYVTASEESPISEEDKDKDKDKVKDEPESSKNEITSLLNKARKNKLKDEDYDKIAEILSDPSKYKEYGITTGFFSNKGKTLLFALSRGAEKSYFDDKKLIKSMTEVKFRNGDGKEVLTTASFKNWSGLKKLIDDPDKEIAGENNLRKVIEVLENKKELSDNEKLVLEKAKRGVYRFEALRNASRGYSEIVAKRYNQNKFLNWFKNKDTKALDKAREEDPAGTVVDEPKKEDSDPLGLKEKTVPPSGKDLETTAGKDAPSKDDIEL